MAEPNIPPVNEQDKLCLNSLFLLPNFNSSNNEHLPLAPIAQYRNSLNHNPILSANSNFPSVDSNTFVNSMHSSHYYGYSSSSHAIHGFIPETTSFYNQPNFLPSVQPVHSSIDRALNSYQIQPNWSEAEKLAYRCNKLLIDLKNEEAGYVVAVEIHISDLEEMLYLIKSRLNSFRKRNNPNLLNNNLNHPSGSQGPVQSNILQNVFNLNNPISSISTPSTPHPIKNEPMPMPETRCAYPNGSHDANPPAYTTFQVREPKISMSEVTSIVINTMHKTSEMINYGMGVFSKIETTYTNTTYQSFWVDCFLNYFEGNLKGEKENFLSYWSEDISEECEKRIMQINLREQQSISEFSAMLESNTFAIEYILLCLELFLEKYFGFLLDKISKMTDEIHLLCYYGETWQHFLDTTMSLSQKYIVAFGRFFKLDKDDVSPILTKSLQCWRYAFFEFDGIKQIVPESIWVLIKEEEQGGPRDTTLIPESVVLSYQVLGLIEKPIANVDTSRSPGPIDCFEFVDWHVNKYTNDMFRRRPIEQSPSTSRVSKASKAIAKRNRPKTKLNFNNKKSAYARSYLQKQKLELEKLRLQNKDLQEIVDQYKKKVQELKYEISKGMNHQNLSDSWNYGPLLQEIFNIEENMKVRNLDEMSIDSSYSFLSDPPGSESESEEQVPCDFTMSIVSRVPHQLSFWPPTLPWRRKKCKEFGFAPVVPTDFGTHKVISWSCPPEPHRIMKIKGDGNCLFRALVFFLTGVDSDIHHVRMRHLICRYYDDHQDDPFVKSLITKYAPSVQEYLNQGMRMPGKWGTEAEIQVFAKMVNCQAAVWNPDFFQRPDLIRWNRYNFSSVEYQPTLFLLFKNAHFDVCLM